MVPNAAAFGNWFLWDGAGDFTSDDNFRGLFLANRLLKQIAWLYPDAPFVACISLLILLLPWLKRKVLDLFSAIDPEQLYVLGGAIHKMDIRWSHCIF